MELMDKIKLVEQQEKELVFDAFDHTSAWKLGELMVKKAFDAGVSFIIDIAIGEMTVFHYACQGRTPDNEAWVARKKNVVKRYYQSSFAFQLDVAKGDWPLSERKIDLMAYAAAGGAFPIRVKGAGIIGTIAVSGMSDEEDHQFVVEAIEEYLKA